MELKTLNEMEDLEKKAVVKGIKAAMKGKSASSCPFNFMKFEQQKAWLQGFVTQSDCPTTGQQILKELSK